MHRIKQRGARRGRQRGVSLGGLVFALVALGLGAVLAMKIAPTVIEYRAISNAVAGAKAAGTSARDIRAAFDKSASVNYIESIGGKDLLIEKDNGELEVSFAYEKKIALIGPASLLLSYAGSTAKGGARPKPAE